VQSQQQSVGNSLENFAKGLRMMSRIANLRSLIIGAASLVIAAIAMPQAAMSESSSAIKAIVSGVVITSGDVAKRVNFLKLRQTKGNLQKIARDELVDEVLMRQEIIRTSNSVSTDDVDAAYGRFAKNNKMSVEQLSRILTQAGIGAEHFKAYIGVQMSWPRVVQARYGGQKMSNDELVDRLRKDGGKKPTTTEYFLQKVIFVIPESKRGKITGKRKSEAEASRKRYPGCEQAKVFAATMKDVSIQNIGRVLEPQLPENWKAEIAKAQVGGTTAVQTSELGVEYLGICKKREVSDDLAAQVVYQAKDLQTAEKDSADPNSKKYLESLRKNSTIDLR
jgi:peptidyl-prolyl cis-trans isomerase SurA